MLNSLPRKPSAADALERILNGKTDSEPEPTTWIDAAIEIDRRNKELEAKWEAERKAKAEAKTAPTTTPGILIAEIAKASTNSGSGHMPLNGAQVLRAALSGMGVTGTIDGGNG